MQIRRRVCASLPEEEFNLDSINNEIELECKANKSFFECFSIYRFYNRYLKDHIEITSPDYAILKQHFTIKTYSSCFVNNDKWYAGIVRKLYKFLREAKNRHGGMIK